MKLSIPQETALRAIDAGTIYYNSDRQCFIQGVDRRIARSREILVHRPNTVCRALHRRGLLDFLPKLNGLNRVVRIPPR